MRRRRSFNDWRETMVAQMDGEKTKLGVRGEYIWLQKERERD